MCMLFKFQRRDCLISFAHHDENDILSSPEDYDHAVRPRIPNEEEEYKLYRNIWMVLQ